MSQSLLDVVKIYEGSNGDATKAMYDMLKQYGPVGDIAVNVFRAHKNSARAKVYRGGVRGKGSYKSMAYERKRWAMENLAKSLCEYADRANIKWGWGVDRKENKHNTVLYIDLPTGQVSFHTDARGPGPDYPGRWDGERGASVGRVCEFVAKVLDSQMPERNAAA